MRIGYGEFVAHRSARLACVPGPALRDVRPDELPERELLRGERERSGGHLFGAGLVVLGFAIDATSIISLGGGFVFALLCGPLLLVALIATLAMRVR